MLVNNLKSILGFLEFGNKSALSGPQASLSPKLLSSAVKDDYTMGSSLARQTHERSLNATALRRPLANPVRRRERQGRPYKSSFSTRIYVGVGLYSASRPYVAAQFPDSAKRFFVKELSNEMRTVIQPVENAHLTVLPPSDKLDKHFTSKQLFGALAHSTLIFKKAVVTKAGAVLLVAENTTSNQELKRQLKKVAKHYDLPEQSRDLHIVLGHIDLAQFNPSSSAQLSDYQGDNPAFKYTLPLHKPVSVDLNLTAEGNLIAEQISAELEEIPLSQQADPSSVREGLMRFEERASNVERLVQTFLKAGKLSEEDYAELSYHYAKPTVPAYKNNPIYFTEDMLIKAREKNIPLSYQVVPQTLVSALQKEVSGKLDVENRTFILRNEKGEVEEKRMAFIKNPELVVQAFQRDLKKVFEGFDDVVVQQVGSGVTGFSRNPDKPIKPCNILEADVDLAIKSKQILEVLDRVEGVSHMSVNRKIKLANKFTVLANSPKGDDEIGFGQTALGLKVSALSEKWSYLLAGQSSAENAQDPIVDFKLNIDTKLFQSGANLLDLRS